MNASRRKLEYWGPKRNWDHFYYETAIIKDRGRFFECAGSAQYQQDMLELGRGAANALWIESIIGSAHVFRSRVFWEKND